ncbi:sulfite exporter taue/safe [Lucifera butyrica]|uniref:Probable membrane transporter protein n=1 Tax=Lucifera butyrica TaxID=1351585 RepID=A0A498R8R6_9FIRM|nr:sulfite exporter TauE/SafE family protein [Lucifera butyrica]VBB07781.1 sulfite exporter taue/safe [Lucifera butyrica]
MLSIVIGCLLTITGFFSLSLFRDLYKNRNTFSDASPFTLSAIGFIANFLDTLGIGSFAQLTAFFKFFKLVPDRIIPGTLNVSCCIPVILEALIFMTIIEVEPITLISMLAASMVGAFLGAGLVSRLPEKQVQLYMGASLLIVASIITAGLLGVMPVGGEAIELTGSKFILGIIGNFILGALMTIGIGLFAPCMALVYLLGLSPRVAFPIMMGSCAFLQPTASMKFIKEGAYDRKASLWITLLGSAGVLIAAYIVKSLPLTMLKWIVVCVIVFTGITMIRSAFKQKESRKNEFVPS